MSTTSRPKVLFVADSPSGGAGIAAKNIFLALLAEGFDARFLVLHNPSDAIVSWHQSANLDNTHGWVRKFKKALAVYKDQVRSAREWWWNSRKDKFFRGTPLWFDIVTLKSGVASVDQHPWFEWADIVHLHWTAGFLADKQAWGKKKWVISLHDCFPFTAVCHFPATCLQFQTGCYRCPQLKGTANEKHVSSRFRQKTRGMRDAKSEQVSLHAPSAWIEGMAKQSLLLGRFRAYVLPYLYPNEVFRCLDQRACRDLLGLPQDKNIALFVAASVANIRKGFRWFEAVSSSLASQGWEFVIVGGGSSAAGPGTWNLGTVTDLRVMAAAYNAADVFLTTAVQDNLPSTIVESQLCGTPVVGFAAGGQPEMILHGTTGFLSDAISLAGLQEGMAWFESSRPSRSNISQWAHERWDSKALTSQWISFYQGLL